MAAFRLRPGPRREVKCAKSSPTDSVARREYPPRARVAGHLRKARGDVEGQQAQGEATLRQLDAARAFVLFGVHHRSSRVASSVARAEHCAIAGSRLCSLSAEPRASRRARDRSCAASAEWCICGEPVESRRAAQDFRERQPAHFSTAPNSTLSVVAGARNCVQLEAGVAQQQLDLAAAEARAEELRSEIRDLVRLIEDHRIRGAQQVAEAVFLECKVRKQQVVIDDNDVGFYCAFATRFDHVAPAEVGATGTEAILASR